MAAVVASVDVACFRIFPRKDAWVPVDVAGPGSEMGWLGYLLPSLADGRPRYAGLRLFRLGDLSWERSVPHPSGRQESIRGMFLASMRQDRGTAVWLLEESADHAGDQEGVFLAEAFAILEAKEEGLPGRKARLEARYSGDMKDLLLALLALAAGDSPGAARALERVRSRGKDYKVLSGLAHAAEGRREEAWSLLNEGLAPPAEPLLLILAADGLERLRRLEPDEHFLYCLLAQVERRQGHPISSRIYARHFVFFEQEGGEWSQRCEGTAK